MNAFTEKMPGAKGERKRIVKLPVAGNGSCVARITHSAPSSVVNALVGPLRSVATKPGLTTRTTIPSSRSSWANPTASAFSAVFDAL
ncbi:hypothetical protein QEG98_09400 [Myxococcus sp. MxC21-1]|uniref:hypothetical protein n=1 Tax=Myxococcus sp. MxC21-1 TaxID=3041439 RepID=UPI00292EE318|nr:hypothetical protein [Myxococcus sp. MxC21-1]WNZ63883.1 hypothetical protein QEG98_09400 [Myxococcus sp. MxC21-1]